MGRKKNGEMGEINKKGTREKVVVHEGAGSERGEATCFYNIRWNLTILLHRCGFVNESIYINKLNTNLF
jgi:hypothetical protein